MKITCLKNPDHKQFVVSAHVAQEWVVDDEGQFVRVDQGSLDTCVHHPNSQDYYVCYECGEDANVTP